MARARNGDREAFGTLARLALPTMDRIASLTLRDADAAHDAVQEALLRAWRDLPSLRDLDRFEAWLRRLVVRACIDELRRSRGVRLHVELTELAHPTVADAALATADRDSLERAFQRLDPVQRSVVVLYYYLDLPLGEIGSTLGLPVGTVKSTLSRARASLRAAVEADGRGGLLADAGAA